MDFEWTGKGLGLMHVAKMGRPDAAFGDSSDRRSVCLTLARVWILVFSPGGSLRIHINNRHYMCSSLQYMLIVVEDGDYFWLLWDS